MKWCYVAFMERNCDACNFNFQESNLNAFSYAEVLFEVAVFHER